MPLNKETKPNLKNRYGLIWLNGMSTIVGYSMSDSFMTNILNIWFLNIFDKSQF